MAFNLSTANPVAPPKEKESGWEDFGEGLVSSGLDTYYGIKGLFTDLTDDEKARIEDWRSDAAESGWGTAGRVVGELGQLALPAGVLTKGLKLAAKAQKLGKTGQFIGKTAPVTADVLASTGHGALKMPQEGESRLGNALSAGGASVVGGTVGAGLKKAVKGMRKTPEATKVLDEGGYLTPAQATSGDTLQSFERLMRMVPLLGRGTRDAQEKALGEWQGRILNEASPSGTTISKTGNEGFEQLEASVNDAYSAAWDGVKEFPFKGADRVLNQIDEAIPNFSPTDIPAFKRIEESVLKLASEGDPAKTTKALDRAMRDEVQTAVSSGNHALLVKLQELRKTFRSDLPEETLEGLLAIDKKYPDYLTVMKATAKAKETRGVFKPKQLLSASAQVGDEASTAANRGPLMPQAMTANEMYDFGNDAEIMGIMRRFGIALPAILPMKTIGNTLIGQNPLQRGTVKAGQTNVGQALRKYASPARLGAAYED